MKCEFVCKATFVIKDHCDDDATATVVVEWNLKRAAQQYGYGKGE